MAIILNDNIQVKAPKPSEFRYFHPDNRPWVSLSEVVNTIPLVERHIGLTVNIDEVEYWFQTSINDGDLVIKQSEVEASSNKLQTPIITNIGGGIDNPGSSLPILTQESGYRNITIKYGPGNDYFENLVLTGNVRLQLVHFDTKSQTNYRAVGSIRPKQKSYRYVKHLNGAMDVGDSYFGGVSFTNDEFLLPPVESMIYLDSTTKPNQEIYFQNTDYSWFYGNIDLDEDFNERDYVGQILNQFPFTNEDLYSDANTGHNNKLYQIRGEVRKNNDLRVNNYKTSKIFAFVFMYKDSNGKWIQSELSQRFKLELASKIINLDETTTDRYYYGFSLKIMP